ncbi:bone morphogenetic protein 7-like [Styela clava]
METFGYIFHIILFAALTESRPNVPEKKQKRMVPVLVDRNNFQSENRMEWPVGDYESTLYPVFDEGESRTRAMEELLGVLGLKVPENLSEFAMHEKTKKPPKYMVDLYNAIADHNGITRSPGLLDADTVRSIPNIDQRGSHFCKFNLSAVTEDEIILDAELHLFQSQRSLRKMNENLLQQTRRRQYAYSSTYIIKIYQMMSDSESSTPTKRLISARRVHSHHSGWHIFPILKSVKEWMISERSNFGLMTEMITINGEVIENVLDRESLQPILVLFANNKNGASNETDTLPKRSIKSLSALKQLKLHESGRLNIEKEDENTNIKRQSKRRRRSVAKENNKKKQGNNGKTRRGKNRGQGDVTENRELDTESTQRNTEVFTVDQYREYDGNSESDDVWNDAYTSNTDDYDYFADSSEKPTSQAGSKSHSTFSDMNKSGTVSRNCRRYPLYVNFEEMGWSGWIIHPQGYNAYHCKGVCSFPLGQNLNPSNHATVQSIMHTLGLGNQPVAMPCCAPDKLYDINLLYFDQNDYVVLRRYKDMVAASCACR